MLWDFPETKPVHTNLYTPFMAPWLDLPTPGTCQVSFIRWLVQPHRGGKRDIRSTARRT